MQLTDQQYDLLNSWKAAKEELKAASELESQLRDKLVQELFTADKTEGSETVELINGWKLTATKKLNYNLKNDSGQVATICAQLPDVVSRSLVRWKPDLVLATWRKLDAHTQEMFKDALEIKPGKPTLELISPKT